MARPKIDQIANLQTELTSTSDSANNRVLKTGDTMTGQLNISSGGLLVTGNVNFDSGTLFVDSVGDRVGIANSNPNTGYYSSSLKLQVGTAPNNNYTIAAVEAGTQPSLYLRHPIGYAEFYNSYGNIGLNAYLNGEGKSLNTDIFLFEGYNDTANAYLSFFSNKLYISGNGNVGVGNTAPASKLTVAGTVESTSGGIKFPDGTTQTTAAASVTGIPTLNVVNTTTTTAVAGYHYVLANNSATTLTLPASPSVADLVWITVGNGRVDNIVGRNGSKINSLEEDLTIDIANVAIQLRYVDSTRGWLFT